MNSRLAVFLLLIAAASSHAAPGLVHSSSVERGDVYAEVRVKLSCNAVYLGHTPQGSDDVLRIRLETTTVCAGVSPTVVDNYQILRPQDADSAWLSSIEYFGDTPSNRHLNLSFDRDVRFDVRQVNANNLVIRVFGAQPVSTSRADSPVTPTRRVEAARDTPPRYVINLASSQRAPTSAELPVLSTPPSVQLFVEETLIGDVTWYRTRLGYYDSAEEASRALRDVRESYPRAWIDRVVDDVAGTTTRPVPDAAERVAAAESGTDDVADLMGTARRAMIAGELAQAVQLYTKVLRMPKSEHHPVAQEYLALARERNGQIAHAKAEYERYLDVYGEHEGAERVRQRLSALLTSAPRTRSVVARTDKSPATRSPTDWKIRSFFAQHYRRDVNQVNDLDEIVSQSSVYTDVNVDARRRGERFDFSARLSGGYRYDLLDDTNASGNDLRLSYAYADIADATSGLRGRFGRQTRNNGGVLGRFDGLNVSYAMSERLQFDTVVGKPVYTTTEGVDDARRFYGVSSTFGLFHKDLDFGVFYLQQEIDGMTDREAVGAEVRYFGEKQSLWSVIDYDLAFGELGSVFVQGSWRLPRNFTITGLYDQRRSPFLNLGNALIGQQLDSFADLQVLFTEDEIRALALDRAPESTTVTFGVAKPLTPKVQLNLTASLSDIDAAPASGGVAALDATEYNYYSGDLVISSLFTENDVSIFGLRYAQSSTTDVISANIDTRFRIGRRWRVSPRLRVDYREILADQSTQWIVTPGVRLHYRHDRRIRVEFEAGTQLSSREMATTDQERKSYFVNLGYQWLF